MMGYSTKTINFVETRKGDRDSWNLCGWCERTPRVLIGHFNGRDLFSWHDMTFRLIIPLPIYTLDLSFLLHPLTNSLSASARVCLLFSSQVRSSSFFLLLFSCSSHIPQTLQSCRLVKLSMKKEPALGRTCRTSTGMRPVRRLGFRNVTWVWGHLFWPRRMWAG